MTSKKKIEPTEQEKSKQSMRQFARGVCAVLLFVFAVGAAVAFKNYCDAELTAANAICSPAVPLNPYFSGWTVECVNDIHSYKNGDIVFAQVTDRTAIENCEIVCSLCLLLALISLGVVVLWSD